MAERDFRYEMPDGSEVEAFQLTEATRYNEKLWPDWFNSRMFMTADKEGKKTQYLNINDVETEIPPYGWIVLEGGRIKVVDWEEMEHAEKVVPEILPIPDKAKPLPDDALLLAAKLSGKSVEEMREQDEMQVAKTNRLREEMIARQSGIEPEISPEAEDLAAQREAEIAGKPVDDLLANNSAPGPQTTDDGLILECAMAYESLKEGHIDAGVSALHKALAPRVNWCNCAPGQCAGGERLTCRLNSPLAQ